MRVQMNIFGLIGILLLISGIASGFVAYYAVMNLLKWLNQHLQKLKHKWNHQVIIHSGV